MTSTRWMQIKSVVARALESPPDVRQSVLDEECRGDPTLRREVESLLAAAEDDESFPRVRAAIAAETNALTGARRDEDHSLRQALEGVLGHQYEIVRRLGSGGMGAVYLANDRALERFVAIKVLRPDLAAAPESRERFRREARVAAQLSHPGILPLHTFGEVGGIWYFVMGYVRGETLADRLRHHGPLPATEARRILTELADAVDCAHRHGVVHRDIKPSNILLDAGTGRAILADFGISKMDGAGDSLTATGVVVGTPHYMSPEQSLGAADVDERSDLYALGVVGYAMLSGREPFAGTAAEALTPRKLSDAAPSLQSIAPVVPEALSRIVMRCLERDRTLRWPTAGALSDALARTTEDATLPEAIRDLPGFGPYALLWAVGWLTLAGLAFEDPLDRTLLGLVALVVPAGLVLHVWNIGRQDMRSTGIGFLELLRIAYWPPEWWGMWWPPSLRRPNDLWPSLPWPARLTRIVMSAFFVSVPVLVLARSRLPGSDDGHSARVATALFAAATAVVLAVAAAWATRRGLSIGETSRLLVGPTIRARAWRAPKLACLLRGGEPAAPDPNSAADLRRAIDEALRRLGTRLDEGARSCAQLSERLVDAIDRLDGRRVQLESMTSAGELDRLTAQLARLGESTAGDSPERRQLRNLLRQQTDVLRRMRTEAEVVAHEHERQLDLLRATWSQLSALERTIDSDEERSLAHTRLCAILAEIEDSLPTS